jgi:ABC-2 type transport system ATP-binding protein
MLITASDLSKTFRVAQKEPGFVNTLRHFVRRRYKQVEAVKRVSFAIEPGEIVGFLGPNGAGKTTTLKLLTGLIHPTSGTVRVAGHEPFRREAAFLRQITLVMGNKQQLIWDLPMLDSLRINAEVYAIERAEARRRIDELADMLDLHKHLTQPVRKLSLGERMKAELLAALLHRPAVLFLDEPTLGLDVNAQSSVRDFLRQYNRQHRATVLLTSHYMADITALCPRVLVIHEGSLMYDGSLTQIVQRLSPFRQVRVELGTPPDGRDFSQYGEVESVEGRVVRLIVQRETLTAAIARLMAELDVTDLTVSDPPVEDVIGRLFKQGALA